MKFEDLSPEAKAKFRQQCAKGGKAGKHEDKVRAGKLGYQARLKKLMEQTEKKP